MSCPHEKWLKHIKDCLAPAQSWDNQPKMFMASGSFSFRSLCSRKAHCQQNLGLSAREKQNVKHTQR